METFDIINHPIHYNSHPSGIECITVTEKLSFCRGNAVKYLWRAGEKGNLIQDLEKAIWYIERERKRLVFIQTPPAFFCVMESKEMLDRICDPMQGHLKYAMRFLLSDASRGMIYSNLAFAIEEIKSEIGQGFTVR